MKDRFQDQWEALGASDPYWAVLTNPQKKGGRWDHDEFFGTGQEEIQVLLAKINRLGIRPRRGLALDFGCGVGRLSRALAGAFERVLAVDMAESMLAEARAANAAYVNITFERNDPDNLASVASGSVDLVYSNITLQHALPATQTALIREFCRVLGPDGVLVFQTPSRENPRSLAGLLHRMLGNRLLNLVRRLRYGKDGVMEIHTLRRAAVLDLLASEGMEVIAIERYDTAGSAFVSFRYFATKGGG